MRFYHKFLVFLTCILGFQAMPVFAQENHRVEANQTLYSIARLYNLSVNELMALNNLSSPRIRPGQVLIVKAKQGSFKVDLSPQVYKVEEGDSLSYIALKYGTTVEELLRLNGLKDENIFIGQKITLRSTVGTQIHTVQSGESLSVLSARFGISQDDLKTINQLTDSRLKVGQVLRVFKPRELPLSHEVQEMDTLPGLASLYGLKVQDIKAMNQLQSDSLKPGTVLRLRSYQAAGTVAAFNTPSPEEAAAPQIKPSISTINAPAVVSFPEEDKEQTYTVKQGDSLYRIAKNFGTTAGDIKAWNRLTSENIKPGQKLILKVPGNKESAPVKTEPVAFPAETSAPNTSKASVFPAFEEKLRESLTWDNLVVLNRDIPLFEWNNDYYYWSHPGETSQPSKGYYENQWTSPWDAYKKASQLFKEFDSMASKRPLKSHTLDGYTFVLDPGHGGLDPGAIVKTTDGNGDTLYITEDEYVYDIALRMYVLLKEHGAKVHLTTLSPNHLIRDTTPATRTLINEKNEVYNDSAANQSNKNDDWVAGGQAGLEKRIQIAGRFFQGAQEGKKVFISLHADNSPKAPMGTGVFINDSAKGLDLTSQKIAEKLMPYLGKDAYIRTENLGVLRGNPADYKVLVEVRNVAYPDHSWALRLANARQLDAQKIVRGFLEALK